VPEAISRLNTEVVSSACGLLAMTHAESGGIIRADKEIQDVEKLTIIKMAN
jgi:hypothetical protein